MKKLLTFCFSLLFSFSIYSYTQNDTIWFDSNWKETSKKDASFYRPEVTKKGNGFWIIDYYISGSKQMEGLSLEEDSETFDGVVTWFYDNGNKHQLVNYRSGALNGKRLVYYESGKIKSDSFYRNGKNEGKWKLLYENGNTKETGNYENGQKEGLWKTYYENGKLKEEGKYVFDRKVDVWKINYYDGTEKDE